MIIESIQTCQQNENKNVEVIVVLGCVCLIGLIVHAGVVVQLLLLLFVTVPRFVVFTHDLQQKRKQQSELQVCAWCVQTN